MNWMQKVVGTMIIDYADADQRKSILRECNAGLKACDEIMGYTKLLRSPPPCNPINNAGFMLGSGLHKNYIEYFFDEARKSGPVQVANHEVASYNRFSATGSGALNMTWTYDGEIRFKAAEAIGSNDLEKSVKEAMSKISDLKIDEDQVVKDYLSKFAEICGSKD